MVKSAEETRGIGRLWIRDRMSDFTDIVKLWLPEIDDRYNLWRGSIGSLRLGSNNQGERELRFDKG